MSKLLLAITTILLLSPFAALAGPNAGVQLHVHGNVDGISTDGNPCALIPENCEEFEPSATEDEYGVEWFVVIVSTPDTNTPSFNTVIFGLGDYNSADAYIGIYGPCSPELGPLEVVSAGWPGPLSGTAVTWAPHCFEDFNVPVYYFGVYAYGTDRVPLGDFYPGHPAGVVSCIPEEDPFEEFGALGAGEDPGFNPLCPSIPTPTGACCFGEDCVIMTEEECLQGGGEYMGDGVSCEPNPCENCTTPTESTTWGRIKVLY